MIGGEGGSCRISSPGLWLQHLGGWWSVDRDEEEREGQLWDQNQSRFGCTMFKLLMNYLRGVIEKETQIQRGEARKYKFGSFQHINVICSSVSK